MSYFIILIIGAILGWSISSIIVVGKITDLETENYFLIQKVNNLEREKREREKNEYES